MTYVKPDITVLGDAASVIQNTTVKQGSSADGSQNNLIPAYDLDE